MLPWPVVPAWRNSVARLRPGYVSDGLQEPSVIEPINPFQGGELDGLIAAPWPAPVDHLGLVETVDGFGEGTWRGLIADRGFDGFAPDHPLQAHGPHQARRA